jgi:AcrR family transcriptional regulator
MAARTATRSLPAVAAAAHRVLKARGYRQTGISDVSAALGLSHGALYTYVRSKGALLYLALVHAMRPAALEDMATPVEAPPEEEFVGLARRWMGDAGSARLAAALQRREVGSVREEFGGIVDEFYAFIEGNRDALALIEKCAREVPEMFQAWFVRNRRGHFAALSGYLEARIRSGHLRAVPDVPTAARFIVETIAWFAWHRLEDADSAMLSDDRCRETVRHLLLAAFVPAEAAA